MLLSLGALSVMIAVAHGGTLVGKLDFPQTPSSAPPATKGFLDRSENPFAPVRPLDIAHQVVVVVEGDEKPVAPGQVMWDLVGESFARPVVAAPAGAEVVIRNVSKVPRTLVVKENPKLLDPGPLNPTATKSFKATDVGKAFTVGTKMRRTSSATSSSSTRSSSRTPTSPDTSRSTTFRPAPTR